MGKLSLALDSSSSSGSIAITDGDELIGEWTVGKSGTHGKWLLSSIDGLLSSVGVKITDIDNLVLSQGPGSFTGLRVGVSIVKGLSWGSGKAITGVSTLDTLAMNVLGFAPSEGDKVKDQPYFICPILDARKGELYAALYKVIGAKSEKVLSDRAIAPEALFKEIDKARGGGEVKVVFL